MATLIQIRDKADAKLVDFWQALVPKQDAYFAKHGKYFQLVITDKVVDGSDTVWEIRKPNDEKHAIDVDFEFNSPIPFQISVDEWVGEGKGYSATATIELLNGDIYKRTHHSNGDDTGWSQYVPEVIEITG